MARAFFARLAGAGSPSDREVSHPDAFLPYGHQLFACILAFGFAYAYAMRHAVPQGQLELYAPAALALLCTAAYAALAKARLKIDALFTVSFAFVPGGFLLVVLDDPRVIPAASSLLVGGYLCFNVLMWFVLCNIAARNPLDAIPVMSWGLATSYLGIFVGAPPTGLSRPAAAQKKQPALLRVNRQPARQSRLSRDSQPQSAPLL